MFLMTLTVLRHTDQVYGRLLGLYDVFFLMARQGIVYF